MRDYLQDPVRSRMVRPFAGFFTLRPAEAILLGAPLIGLGSATNQDVEARCSDLHTAIAIDLELLPPTMRWFFFVPPSVHRHSYISSMFTLRRKPSFRHARWPSPRSISAICSPHLGDLEWIQASLPIRKDRLGIRRVSVPALSASFGFCCEQVWTPNHNTFELPSGVDNTVHAARVRCCSINNLSCPGDECLARQRSWDAPGISRYWTTIRNDCANVLDKVRLLALRAAHSNDWLLALPISSCRLCMCDETVRVAVGLCLGYNLCEAHTSLCGALMNARDTHGLSC